MFKCVRMRVVLYIVIYKHFCKSVLIVVIIKCVDAAPVLCFTSHSQLCVLFLIFVLICLRASALCVLQRLRMFLTLHETIEHNQQ